MHTLDICQQIAETLKSPDTVSKIINDALEGGHSYSEEWIPLSLGNGWAGIALWYSIMDHIFPDQKWERYAHEYLKLSTSYLENGGYTDFSLFQGLSGLCAVAYTCSKGGIHYFHLLDKLDCLLIDQLEDFFRLPQEEMSLNSYNFMEGLSGTLCYLTLRPNDVRLLYYAKKCLSKILHFLNQKQTIFGHLVPAWYISAEKLILEEEKEKFAKGYFPLGLFYGITGILSSLSIAALEGIWVDELKETIGSVVQWLKHNQKNWHYMISFEEAYEENTNTHFSKDKWFHGHIFITRSLYLAACALKDENLKKFAQEIFLQLLSKPVKEWGLLGSSLSNGKAGVLATAYQMFQDTRHPDIRHKLEYLEDDLKKLYHPSLPFGFQSINVTPSGDYQYMDDPGFLDGAIGIALSLLSVQGRDFTPWTRIFLMG